MIEIATFVKNETDFSKAIGEIKFEPLLCFRQNLGNIQTIKLNIMEPERNMESTNLSLLPNGNIFVAYTNIYSHLNMSIYDISGCVLIERRTINLIGNVQIEFLTPFIATKQSIYFLKMTLQSIL